MLFCVVISRKRKRSNISVRNVLHFKLYKLYKGLVFSQIPLKLKTGPAADKNNP